jgi:hypothetical protein
MVLRITDRPKFVENPIRIDPYEQTLAAITSRNYKECAKILKGKRSVRKQASVPTALLRIDPRQYISLIKGVKKFGAEEELIYCFKIARSISREFHNSQNISEIEAILANVDLNQLSKLLPYASFKHIYDVYRLHHEYRSAT